MPGAKRLVERVEVFPEFYAHGLQDQKTTHREERKKCEASVANRSVKVVPARVNGPALDSQQNDPQ